MGTLFLAHLYESIGSYCCHFQVGMGVGIGVTFEGFTTKFLARLDEVQEELLYYPRHRRRQRLRP